jgi:hypothetical protein
MKRTPPFTDLESFIASISTAQVLVIPILMLKRMMVVMNSEN